MTKDKGKEEKEEKEQRKYIISFRESPLLIKYVK